MRRAIAAIICITAAAWPARALAQAEVTKEPKRFAAYWELGGAAGLSGNVDVRMTEHSSVRAGGLPWLFSDDPDIPWSAQVSVQHLFGCDGDYLEVGGGIAALHRLAENDARGTRIAPMMSIAYRLEGTRYMMRFGVSSPPPGDSRPVIVMSWGRTF